MDKPRAEAQKLKPETRAHFMYLGTALGSLHDAGLDRDQILFFVGAILDKIEEVKGDPDKLAKFKAGMEAITE